MNTVREREKALFAEVLGHEPKRGWNPCGEGVEAMQVRGGIKFRLTTHEKGSTIDVRKAEGESSEAPG
jgi:hypothetical protein